MSNSHDTKSTTSSIKPQNQLSESQHPTPDKEACVLKVKRLRDTDDEVGGVELKKRKVDSTGIIELPDANDISQLKGLICNLSSAINANETPNAKVNIKDKGKLIALFNLMVLCLEKIEVNEIPDKMPNLHKTDEIINDETGLFQSICEKFEAIAHLRSCVNLDQEFVSKLYEYLGDNDCLEVYAGNGWLSSELKRKGCNVSATDSFLRFDREESKFFPFLRDVERVKASNAVSDFIGKIPEEVQGTILVCYPEGDLAELKSVFRAPLQKPNIRIVAIAADAAARWNMPDNLVSKDLTETLAYIPSRKSERVIEYRSASAT